MKSDLPDILLTFLIAALIVTAMVVGFRRSDRIVTQYAETILERR